MKRAFRGAGIIVKLPHENVPCSETDLVITTKYSFELSEIIRFLAKIHSNEIDYLNKYYFYGKIAEYYNSLIEKYGDCKENLLRLVIKDEIASKKLYYAYGSNMDVFQMKNRCPNSILINRATLLDYKFVLDSSGYASVIKEKNSVVLGLLWLISDEDENNLDRYEGVSKNCYLKDNVIVKVGELEVNSLIYISKRNIINIASNQSYLQKIIKAAEIHHFPSNYINMLKKYIA